MASLYGILRCVSVGCVLAGLCAVVCEGGTDGRSEAGGGTEPGIERRRHAAGDGAALPSGHAAFKCPDCQLSPYDPDLAASVRKLASTERIHLIKYELKFPEYTESPLRTERGDDNGTYNYKANVLYRVFSPHGLKLISMAFNFDALSLSLLRYGVETIDVPVVDKPPWCFRSLTESDRMASMICLLFDDLEEAASAAAAAAVGGHSWDAGRDSVCHQVIEDDDGRATLVFRCCSRLPPSSSSSSSPERRMKCSTAERDVVIDVLYALLAGLKVAFVLFSPIVLQRVLFEGSTKKTSYVVPVLEEQGLNKTMLVKKVLYLSCVHRETTVIISYVM